MQRLLPFLLLLASLNSYSGEAAVTPLFDYQEIPKSNLDLFPQWLSVLARHEKRLRAGIACSSPDKDQCHISDWLTFLKSVKQLPVIEQIHAVNDYANRKSYIIDSDNYDVDDYWATPKEFLQRSGDCEDYAITKMLSLKQLGFDVNKMRVVVVQDTNLRIPHAVMSIETGGETLILDNQIKEVISDKYIYHYVPVYSINETRWWMHLPKN